MLDRRILAGLVIGAIACGRPRPETPEAKVTLTVLPAESISFPSVAEAATASLARARVDGVDETKVSKVSLEIVQLSIECVERTEACYAQVGETLAADRLLFAQIGKGPKRREVEVTVTLFDVEERAPRTAHKVFGSEAEASAGVAALVGEATGR